MKRREGRKGREGRGGKGKGGFFQCNVCLYTVG